MPHFSQSQSPKLKFSKVYQIKSYKNVMVLQRLNNLNHSKDNGHFHLNHSMDHRHMQQLYLCKRAQVNNNNKARVVENNGRQNVSANNNDFYRHKTYDNE